MTCASLPRWAYDYPFEVPQPADGIRQRMASDYSLGVCKSAVASLLRNAGFQHVHTDALDAFADCMGRFVQDIGRISTDYAELCGRSSVNLVDVHAAFRDLDITALDTHQAALDCEGLALPHPAFPAAIPAPRRHAPRFPRPEWEGQFPPVPDLDAPVGMEVTGHGEVAVAPSSDAEDEGDEEDEGFESSGVLMASPPRLSSSMWIPYGDVSTDLKVIEREIAVPKPSVKLKIVSKKKVLKVRLKVHAPPPINPIKLVLAAPQSGAMSPTDRAMSPARGGAGSPSRARQMSPPAKYSPTRSPRSRQMSPAAPPSRAGDARSPSRHAMSPSRSQRASSPLSPKSPRYNSDDWPERLDEPGQYSPTHSDAPSATSRRRTPAVPVNGTSWDDRPAPDVQEDRRDQPASKTAKPALTHQDSKPVVLKIVSNTSESISAGAASHAPSAAASKRPSRAGSRADSPAVSPPTNAMPARGGGSPSTQGNGHDARKNDQRRKSAPANPRKREPEEARGKDTAGNRASESPHVLKFKFSAPSDGSKHNANAGPKSDKSDKGGKSSKSDKGDKGGKSGTPAAPMLRLKLVPTPPVPTPPVPTPPAEEAGVRYCVNNCRYGGKDVPGITMYECSVEGCGLWYHYECLNEKRTRAQLEEDDFICPVCTKSKRETAATKGKNGKR